MTKFEMWCMFYGQIAGIQYHPRNYPENTPDLVQMAKEADIMIEQAELRLKEMGRCL